MGIETCVNFEVAYLSGGLEITVATGASYLKCSLFV